MNPTVDSYFNNLDKWQSELLQLRNILLSCGLTETLKWGAPCYMFQNSNVAMVGGFKDYCVLSFIKGVLLQDAEGILIQQTEQSQSVRIVKFTNVEEIAALKSVLKAYLFEAITVEEAGLKVQFKAHEAYDLPIELIEKLDASLEFKTAFQNLSPGRQRGYILYFSGAKQSQTRHSRIEKYRQQILDGKGFNDCTCGLSKKMPTCDGSHSKVKSKK